MPRKHSGTTGTPYSLQLKGTLTPLAHPIAYSSKALYHHWHTLLPTAQRHSNTNGAPCCPQLSSAACLFGFWGGAGLRYGPNLGSGLTCQGGPGSEYGRPGCLVQVHGTLCKL